MSDFQFNIPSELDESHDFSDVTSDDLMGYLVENNVILKALSDEVSKLNIEVKRGVVINKLNHTQPKVHYIIIINTFYYILRRMILTL